MTNQEQQLLQELFQRLSQTRGAPKDAQAEALVREGLAATPDAAYWLAQRTLLLENALQQAQQQIAQLQQELEQARQASSANGASSFLSGGLGTQFGRAPEPSYQAPAPAPVQAAQPAQPASGWRDRFFGGRPATPAYAPAAPAAPSAAGSFLGTAAASAAGVAGGMFLANGLSNLLGGHHDAQSQHSNSLMDQNAASDSSSHAGSSGDHSGIDQMAQDVGRDSVGQHSASSDWDDGGDFFDDDFA